MSQVVFSLRNDPADMMAFTGELLFKLSPPATHAVFCQRDAAATPEQIPGYFRDTGSPARSVLKQGCFRERVEIYSVAPTVSHCV